MTDEIPSHRWCAKPGCHDISVNPHQDSLCQRHYPGDAPDPAPIDQPTDGLSTRNESPDEAAVVAGKEPTVSEPDATGEFERIDRELQRRERRQAEKEAAEEAKSQTDASSFMGGGGESVSTSSSSTTPRERSPSRSGGTIALPTAALPLDQLDSLSPADRRRAARKRGVDWPTTEEARNRLEDTVFDVFRHEDDRVVDAPTSLGKTHTIAATRWGARDDLTGDRPVVHLLETRDARDEAIEVAEEHGGEYFALLARHEACPVAAGDHDPHDEDVDEEDPDREPLTIGGEPASEWIKEVCDGRGVPFSAAHRHLEEHNDQGVDLPCCSDGPCRAIQQWDDLREGDHPLIIATHNFAHVPGLRMNTNMVIDEEPDFKQDLSTDRIRRAVGAFLREIDAPVSTWEAFVQLAGYEGYGDDAGAEREALMDAVSTSEPDRQWYFENSDAHTLAPALARAIMTAQERANGRRVGKTMYEPPRLDANAREDDAWNTAWVTVVVDETNEIRSVRSVPHFGPARSLVGLDAHPALPVWQANTAPWIKSRAVLDPDERQLWRRYERGLRVVQVGDATRPLASGEYFDYDGARVLVEQLSHQYGNGFRTAITAKSVEGQLKSIMSEFVPGPETMHYGEEKSRNDFADESIGLVNGSIDPGDDHVLDLLAELDLEAEPERGDVCCRHCGDRDDAPEEPGQGCHECLGTGWTREHDRGFVGEDADTAAEILGSVRENHTAQAAGRYARNPDEPSSTATVFVRTDAIPPGFADVQVPGVTWTFTKTQEQIVTALRESSRPRTARDLAVEADCSKEHVRKTLTRLVDDDRLDDVQAFEGGTNGATLYAASGVPNSGLVDLGGDIANTHVLDTYTWSLAIRDPVELPSSRRGHHYEAGGETSEVWDWEVGSEGGG